MASRGGMSSRQRVLATLRGEPTDRVAVDFDLGHFREALRQRGIADADVHFGVDLKRMWFLPQTDAVKEPPGGPRVGNQEQVANYRLWQYHPERIDRRSPLIEAGSIAQIEAYRFPVLRAEDIARLRSAVAAHHERGFAVSGQIPHLGGVLFETAYRLRGLDNLLEDFRSRPEFATALLERITEAACRNVVELAAAGVDIVVLGDDIGTPTSLLLSPQMWRQWLRPRLARVIAAVRGVDRHVAIAYHSDGYFMPIVKDLVEIGVGVLNPVQPDCMDPGEVRRRFGGALVLWGTVGSATLFAYGTPDTVAREVHLRMETVGRGGRLILGPAYDFEDNVPLENALVFFAARGPATGG